MKNWKVLDQQFYPNELDTIIDLDAGTYRICFNEGLGIGLERVTAASDVRYKLPMPAYETFMNEMNIFLKSRARYDKYGFSYKRGAILYGSPGNGKSKLIEAISEEVTAKNGLTIFMNRPQQLHGIISLITSMRTHNPNRFLLLVMEELDLLLESLDRSDQSTFLNMLDGGSSIDNVLYLATTNRPENLQSNIYDRPSRFDLRLEVGKPSIECIRAYMEQALRPDDLAACNMDRLMVELDGLSLAALKEFIIAHYVIGNDYRKTIDRLHGMKQIPRNTDGKKEIGFSNQGNGHMLRSTLPPSRYEH